MARVNVDEIALSDPRFQLLARLMGHNDPDIAIGRMVRVWRECVVREVYHLPRWLLNAIFSSDQGADWVLEAKLADKTNGDNLRIRGTKGRTDYLKKKREIARINGLKGGRPKKPTLVSSETDIGIQRKPMETPPAPAPAPALPPTSGIPSESPTPQEPRRKTSRNYVSSVASKTEATEPAVLTFKTNGLPESWNLTEPQVNRWTELYPGLDVLTECKLALAWTEANGPKTARGMLRFLNAWLSRANDNGRRGNGRAPSQRMTLSERNQIAIEKWLAESGGDS